MDNIYSDKFGMFDEEEGACLRGFLIIDDKYVTQDKNSFLKVLVKVNMPGDNPLQSRNVRSDPNTPR